MGLFDKLFKKESKRPEPKESCKVCGRKIKDIYFDRLDLVRRHGFSMKLGDIINVILLEKPEYTKFQPIRLTDKDKKPLGYITKREEIMDNMGNFFSFIFSKPYIVCKNCGATICKGCSETVHMIPMLNSLSDSHFPWKNYPNCPECCSDKSLLFEYDFQHEGIVPYSEEEIHNYSIYMMAESR